MTAKAAKIAEFQLTRIGSHMEPNHSVNILLMSYQGKILALRKGEDRYAMPLGKFYNTTLEGMYMLKYLRGKKFRFENLDGAVVKYWRRAGSANSSSGWSVQTVVRFKDGKHEEFCY